jgi:hypothetical protein
MYSRCNHLPENEPPASVVVGIEATATKQVYLAYPTVSSVFYIFVYFIIWNQGMFIKVEHFLDTLHQSANDYLFYCGCVL